jgi:hypothetical protein
LHTRSRFFLFVLAALTAVFACSDSDDTPLGSEFIDDGLLRSRPGVVFEDSIDVSGDTVVTLYTTIGKEPYLELGNRDGYDRTILVKADFSSPGDDVQKTVEKAELRLRISEDADYADQIDARFYLLGTPYDEDSLVVTLDTTEVIPDETGAANRTLTLGDRLHWLPPDLVQAWIRGDSVHNGIAVVGIDAAGTMVKIGSRQSSSSDQRPLIEVVFTDQTKSNYYMSEDGTFVRPTSQTDNLIVSDGYVRRTYFQVDLSQVDDSAAVHDARVVFHIVPGTVFGANQTVLLYVPNDSDPTDPDFLTGQGVNRKTIDASSGTLEITIKNTLLDILAGTVKDNGFVLRWNSENTEVRQAELYTSGDGPLRPKVYITYSTPTEFDQ